MKKIVLTTVFTVSALLAKAQTDFITKWYFPNGGTNISFYCQTLGNINYTWTCSPSGNTGSGVNNGFSTSVILPINILVGDTVTLSIDATDFKYIQIKNDSNLIDIAHWGNTHWISMEGSFYNNINLQISATDVPDLTGATSLKSMFNSCTSLNSPANINSWDVSNITNTTWMFWGATNFNQPLNNWNTANFKNMSGMFGYASTFNQPLNNWNTSNVTNMDGMFKEATNFNQPLNSWNINKVTDISSMFKYASTFNQPLNNWNTSNITRMDEMFNGAINFNQPLTNWNTNNVMFMNSMFQNAKAFNQNIGDWELAVNAQNMLDSSGMDCSNLSLSMDGWVNAWVNKPYNPNVVLGAANLKYGTLAQNNYNTLFLNGWIINGVTASGTSCYYLPERCFATKWYFADTATSIKFDCETWNFNTKYTWTASPSGNTGSGTIPLSSVNLVNVTIPINIAKGDTVTLGIEPADLKRIKINNKSTLIDVAQWGNANWTSMDNAFYNDSNLQVSAIDLPNLAAAISLEGMFRNCTTLNGPSNINSWDISNITNTNLMFSGASNFNKPLNNWNTGKIKSTLWMFYFASKFNQPLNNWNTSNDTMMAGMFMGASSFNQPLNNWNTSNVKFMDWMFENATSFNQPLDSWDISKVTSTIQMFMGASSFNQPLNNWNTSNVKFMNWMFNKAIFFNQTLDNWNTSNVKNMSFMFTGAINFNQSLNDWNTSNVIDMREMFREATNFNEPLNNWNMSNVKNMSCMFLGASNFNQPLHNWNTSSTTAMDWMFYGATKFNQSLNNWNTVNVTNMARMFDGATNFNQSLNNWNTTNVKYMTYMFYNARAFNQRLDSLVFAKNANAKHMLDSCGMDCSNYSLTLNGWANNPINSDSINLGAANLKYGTNAQNAHTTLINTKHWKIVGDTTSGASCNPILPSCNTTFTITKDTIAANTWNMYIQNTTPNMQLQLSFGDSTTTALLPVDSLNNTTHTYADSGMYSVCITAIDSVANCTNTYCDSLAAYRLNGVMKYLKISTKLNANSIITKLTTNTIKLYPNPTTNTLTLTAAQALGTIALHNTLGQVLYTTNSTNATHTINTSELSSGMYYVTVGNTTHKVIKE
ncbi:MAG: BspA family leucine-rich repeat surface protein [Bacteroidia bacterium]